MKGESHVETVPIELGDRCWGVHIEKPKFHIGQKLFISLDNRPKELKPAEVVVIGMCACIEKKWDYTLYWIGCEWVDEISEAELVLRATESPPSQNP